MARRIYSIFPCTGNLQFHSANPLRQLCGGRLRVWTLSFPPTHELW
jgi:hypothetical protein